MRILKAILIFIMVSIFLVGFAICAFPIIQNIVVENQLRQNAEDFLNLRETETVHTEPTNEDDPTAPTEPTEPPREHKELWDEMIAYNEALWINKQAGLSDPWSYTQPSFTLGDFGLEDEIFGVITIPALDLEMPIYLGATNSHLAAGAAQLSQTSIPIGGKNTNAVIAGHRGYSGASYFRYVPELKIGDKVIITNLWEELTYKVVATDIIAPNDVEKVLIQEGRDMITLITCHPYASGGKQRYVIYCEREYDGT